MKKLDLGTLALIAGALFVLPKLLGSSASPSWASQQNVDYWSDGAGNVTYAPGLTPPAGFTRPASQYEIDQWSISQGGGMI